jgi:hypothetical protein
MRLNLVIRIPLLLLVLVSAACNRTPQTDTPEEFIAAMRDAYQSKDADDVMELTVDLKLLYGANVPAEFREELEQYNRDREREDLEREFERGGMWARAWSGTRYVSSREHGDHIHVKVEVERVPSEVVLVRQGDSLKLHPRPSFLKCPQL